MAASPTPRPTPPAERARELDSGLSARLAACQPALPLAVAFSGGADSTALLLMAARVWPGQVHAIHVHHGLQAAADNFEQHCRDVCLRRGLALHVVRVDARHAPGASPEDAARRARYGALAAVARAQGLRTVWLAQHADDQAETLLLALSRGAGLPGLAAMPEAFEREGVRFARPWLDVPGPALRAWLLADGQAWIEDPTNADIAFTRNRIRRELLPALEAAFPAFRETFARSARHAAQAQQLLSQAAADDLAAMGGEPLIEAFHPMARERQANLLRHWLRSAHQGAPSAAQLGELLDQINACRTRGHHIRIKVAGGFVERQGARLHYTPTL